MSAAAALKERLRTDLKAAMQAREGERVRLLRALVAALDNAEAVPVAGMDDFSRSSASDQPAGEVARRELDGAEVDALLAAEIASREQAAVDYARLGRTDEANRLEAEIAFVRAYRG